MSYVTGQQSFLWFFHCVFLFPKQMPYEVQLLQQTLGQGFMVNESMLVLVSYIFFTNNPIIKSIFIYFNHVDGLSHMIWQSVKVYMWGNDFEINEFVINHVLNLTCQIDKTFFIMFCTCQMVSTLFIHLKNFVVRLIVLVSISCMNNSTLRRSNSCVCVCQRTENSWRLSFEVGAVQIICIWFFSLGYFQSCAYVGDLVMYFCRLLVYCCIQVGMVGSSFVHTRI